MEQLLSGGEALTPSAVREALSAVERSVCDSVRAAAADASGRVQSALARQQEAVLGAVRSVGDSVAEAGEAVQLSQEDLRHAVSLLQCELSAVRSTADDILEQVWV